MTVEIKLNNIYSILFKVYCLIKQSYCFIVMFQVYKNLLLHRKLHTIKTYILLLVLSSHSFRGLLSYILEVLSLCEINKHLKDSVFTPLSQLHICFNLKYF